ncbi:hypothetical protein HDV00_001917 [Rhizophlyctis rosea]|nr:hypothetical protein HDV00_001917 [Rhizophlyctis rosea]
MNRNTARRGIIHPREIRSYRKAHPVRMKVGDHDEAAAGTGKVVGGVGGVLKRKAPLPSDGNPVFTYGKPTRPSTPVAELMTDKYQREWMEEQQKQEKERIKREKEKKRGHKRAQTEGPRASSKPTRKMQTVSSPLDHPLSDPSTLFKLSKFKKVGPTISSYREKDDPAMTECDPEKANPPEVFRVVRDKWLGQQPRIWEHGPPTGPLIHPAEATHLTVTMTPERAKGMGPVKVASTAPMLFDEARHERRPRRAHGWDMREYSHGGESVRNLTYENPHALLGPAKNVQVERTQPSLKEAAVPIPTTASTSVPKMRYIREVHPPTHEVRYAPVKEVFHEPGDIPAAYRALKSSSDHATTSGARVAAPPVTSAPTGTIQTVATAVPTIGQPTQDLTNPAPPITINTVATAQVPSGPGASISRSQLAATKYAPEQSSRRVVSFSDNITSEPSFASKAMPDVTRAGYTSFSSSDGRSARMSDLASRTRAPEGGKSFMPTERMPPALPQKLVAVA